MPIGGSKLRRQVKLFKIEMLPAGYGDCIYLEYGNPDFPHRILIDGGPYYAFQPLAERIKEMAKFDFTFDLLVVTHVDSDHVDGIVKLLGSNVSNLKNGVGDIWFNAWKHFEKDPEDLLGPLQGEMLSSLIEENELTWNQAFDDKAVANPNSSTLIRKDLPGGLKLTLLSPTKEELAKLKTVWIREVRKAGLEPGSRDQVLQLLSEDLRLQPKDLLGEKSFDVSSLGSSQFEAEDSRTNASSIAFLVEYEGKKFIFAGDAHPDVMTASIKQFLDQRGEQSLKIDGFKLSHHGSKNNTSPDLLNLLCCKKFFISSNGSRYQHPDPETVARIIKQNGPGVELFFNYNSTENSIWSDRTLQQHYRYKACYPPKRKEGLTILF